MEEVLDYKVIEGVEYPRGTPHKVGDMLSLTKSEAESFADGLIEPAGTGDAPAVKETPPTPPKPPVKDDKVVLSKSQLKDLVLEVRAEDKKEFALELAKRDEKIDTLMKAADTNRLSKALGEGGVVKNNTVRVKLFEGKAIVGWKTVEDTVKKNIRTGAFIESQIMRLILEDESEVDLAYTDFTRAIYAERIEAEVISKTTEDGKVVFKVKRKDNGEELIIQDVFVN